MREAALFVLVSSRAETLNKAIAAGSQKVNVDSDVDCNVDGDVVRQPDYARVWQGGRTGSSWVGVSPGPRPQASICVCVSIMCSYVFVFMYVCICECECVCLKTFFREP